MIRSQQRKTHKRKCTANSQALAIHISKHNAYLMYIQNYHGSIYMDKCGCIYTAFVQFVVIYNLYSDCNLDIDSQ